MIASDKASTTSAWDMPMGSDVRVTLLNPADRIWSSSVNEVEHDVYHLPEYVEFAAKHEGGTPVATFAEWDDHWLLIPLILCALPGESQGDTAKNVDALSPYGYSSPLTDVGQTSDRATISGLRRAFQACIDVLSSQGVISLFSRLHPLLSLPLEALTPFERVVHHGDTVFIDLSLSDEELWKQTRHSHRQDISAACKRGAVAYIDEEWHRFDDFFEIYQQTMKRVKAEDYYLFSKSHFLDLREALADRIHLSVVEDAGSIVSAGIVTEVGGIVETHYAGTRDTFLKWSPNKMRIDFLRAWAKARGNRFLHLGGGVGGRRDSLFEFKLGFSPSLAAFHTARAVLNARAYQDAVGRWEANHGVRADDINGFFPSYRKPSA
jgi:hypothetical protein